jgi:hypothetical protein
MDENKELYVFICENHAVARGIIKEYIDMGKVTFGQMFPVGKRQDIVDALDAIEQTTDYGRPKKDGPGPGER